MISGEEEARLGFRGAISALGPTFPAPVLVVDVGGGSVQLTLGDREGGPEGQISLPLGSNRLTERYVRHDPPKTEELKALREAVLDTLPGWDLPRATPVVAIGGSARAILRLSKRRLTVKHLEKLAGEVCAKPSAMLAWEEGLAPERAQVLPAAITTLAAILKHFDTPSLTVARGGIREGMILTIAEEASKRENPTGGS
jgi:exopolyphosphatase/guanosine-5'-triphosphate,3'-diphosphate pyrophosphatase